MISDVLSEASDEIRRYLSDHRDTYAGLELHILNVVGQMDALRTFLDMDSPSPPLPVISQDQEYPFENPPRKLPASIRRLAIGTQYCTNTGRTVVFTKTIGTIEPTGEPASFVTDGGEIFAANGFNITNNGDNIVSKVP